jgi:hypothetical protein
MPVRAVVLIRRVAGLASGAAVGHAGLRGVSDPGDVVRPVSIGQARRGPGEA